MNVNIGDHLARRAALSPNLEAVVEVERGRRFTYAELDERANRVANAFAELGIEKGDRVALMLMNGVEFIEAFFGLAKLGAVVVPLNFRLTPQEMAFILTDAGAKAVVFDLEFDRLIGALTQMGTPVESWLRVGPAESLPPFAKRYEDRMAAASAEAPEIIAGGDDLLFIMYTSGTTGRPKGAMQTHTTVLWSTLTTLATSDIRYTDRYLMVLPLLHIGALLPVSVCAYRGCTAVIMRSFDVAAMCKTVEAEKATIFVAVPFLLGAMLQLPDFKAADMSSLRVIAAGGSPVPPTLIHAFAARGMEIHQNYGLTESCGPACQIRPEIALKKVGSAGTAFFHTEVKVVGDDGEALSPGEVGELLVRGPHIMTGYWKLPEATAEAIVDGWLRTGDMAAMDEDGCVYIKERKKDVIISGGENIYPAEVEDALLSHPKVREVAVIALPSEKWGETPLAIVVPNEGEAPTLDELKGHCEEKLARFKQPKGLELVEELPRNATGKVLKRVLRERFPGSASE